MVQKAKNEKHKSTKVRHDFLISFIFAVLQSVREMNGSDELIYTMTVDGELHYFLWPAFNFLNILCFVIAFHFCRC